MLLETYSFTENLANEFCKVLEDNGFTFRKCFARRELNVDIYIVAVICTEETKEQLSWLWYNI